MPLPHIRETFPLLSKLLQDEEIYLNLSEQSGEEFKYTAEHSSQPSSSTLPVNVSIDQYQYPCKLPSEEDCGREETVDGVVTLFDDIFIGAILEDSTSETSANPPDLLTRLRYQLG